MSGLSRPRAFVMPESHESSGGFESAAMGWLSENRGETRFLLFLRCGWRQGACSQSVNSATVEMGI